MLISLLLSSVLFAAIYKVLPDVWIAWRDVWVGAVVTSILFNFGRLLIGLYLGRESFASAYGAAGAFVLLLFWVYYSAQVVLLGAEFTKVFARTYGKGFTQKQRRYLRPAVPGVIPHQPIRPPSRPHRPDRPDKPPNRSTGKSAASGGDFHGYLGEYRFRFSPPGQPVPEHR